MDDQGGAFRSEMLGALAVAPAPAAQDPRQQDQRLLGRCGPCPIRKRAVCALCDASELRRLDAIKSYRRVSAGREIFAAGERSDAVGSIVSGVVRMEKTLPDGRRQIVGLLFAADFVGRVRNDRADCDAVAATDVTLCMFQRAPFEGLLKSTQNLERRLLDMTLDELDAAREWLLIVGRKTAAEKVASLLLLLVARMSAARASVSGIGRDSALIDGDGLDAGAKGTVETTIQLPLTRDEMADALGLTLETVSRQMSSLKRAGVIELIGAREMRIADIHALEDVAGFG